MRQWLFCAVYFYTLGAQSVLSGWLYTLNSPLGETDWGHSQLRLVQCTCLLSLFLFFTAFLCKDLLLISHTVWLFQKAPQSRTERAHVNLWSGAYLDWVRTRGNRMPMMLFNRCWSRWVSCQKVTSLLSSVTDSTWLLQDITESYCTNSQE